MPKIKSKINKKIKINDLNIVVGNTFVFIPNNKLLKSRDFKKLKKYFVIETTSDNKITNNVTIKEENNMFVVQPPVDEIKVDSIVEESIIEKEEVKEETKAEEIIENKEESKVEEKAKEENIKEEKVEDKIEEKTVIEEKESGTKEDIIEKNEEKTIIIMILIK